MGCVKSTILDEHFDTLFVDKVQPGSNSAVSEVVRHVLCPFKQQKAEIELMITAVEENFASGLIHDIEWKILEQIAKKVRIQ